MGLISLIDRDAALPGRREPIATATVHAVLGTPIKPPFPEGLSEVQFGMGCFWGAERRFWAMDHVYTTAVGYAGGFTPNPMYEEVCTGRTGHTEVVLVVFDPRQLTLEDLLKVFWESHNPTQGMRQGADTGTQYRSAVHAQSEDLSLVKASRDSYQRALRNAGNTQPISTEIKAEQPFYYAEDYHQQYLAKNPRGYCGLGGTGITYHTQ